jgi:anaerobic ribonucleoside-triphosphate reductase
MVIKSLLEGCLKGVGKFKKTAIFPCGIFQSGKGINQRPGDPNYDLFQLALYCTSKRIYPNYANIDWSNDGKQEDYIKMKKDIIDSLPEQRKQKLIEILKNKPELCEKLGLKIVNKEME